MRISYFFVAFVGSVAAASATAGGPLPKPGLIFEENRGQSASEVRYLARTRQATVFLTEKETVFHVRNTGAAASKGAVVRMSIAGQPATRLQPPAGERPALQIDSYVGAQSRWKTGVPGYRSVEQRGILPGVDMVYHGGVDGDAKQLEYDFLVHPGADPAKIRMRFRGAKRVSITDGGDLRIETEHGGEIVHRKPVIQQGTTRIAGGYRRISANEVGFAVGPYDKRQDLVIDPVVTFAKYYGGAGDDVFTAVSGLAIAGYTNSPEFPQAGAPPAGGYDAFVLITGPSTRVIYVGGAGDDKALAVTMQSLGGEQAIVAVGGETTSDNFPQMWLGRTPSTSETSPLRFAKPGGKADAFVLFTDPSNDPYLSCLRAGGSGDDRILGISLSFRSPVAVGETDSRDLPAYAFAFQQQPGGGMDGLIWSGGNYYSSPMLSYFGGAGNDRLTTVNGTTGLMGGSTDSEDLPLASPFQVERRGGQDALLVRGEPGALAQRRPTLAGFLSGSGNEEITALTFIGLTAYAAGVTTSPDLPGRGESQFRGGASDGFIAQLSWDNVNALSERMRLDQLIYVGGSGTDRIAGIQNFGNELWAGGTTNSADLPTLDAVQPNYGGGDSDAFLAVFQAPALQPIMLTYFGGSGAETAAGVGLDSSTGQVYLAGTTWSASLPSFEGAARNPGSDGFVAGVSSPRLNVSVPALMGKDSLSSFSVFAARLAQPSVRLTVRSSDPGKLLIADGDQGVAERTFNWTGNGLILAVYPLSDSGDAEIIVTAEGYPEVRARTSLGPVIPVMTLSAAGARYTGSATIRPYNPSLISLELSFVVQTASGTTQIVSYPRPGIGEPAITFESSNPRVATATLAYPQVRYGYLNAVAPGQTRITAVISGLSPAPSNPFIDVTVASPELKVQGAAVAGLRTSLSLNATAPEIPGAFGTVTIVEAAPGVAFVNDVGRASRTVAFSGYASLSATRAGSTVKLRFDLQDRVLDSEIPVVPGYIGFSPSTGVRQVGTGTQPSVGMRLGNREALLDQFQPYPISVTGRLARPLTVRLTSSNPSVIAVPDSITFDAGTENPNILVRAGQPGRATIRVESLDYDILTRDGFETTEIEVTPAPPAEPQQLTVRLGSSSIGKDLIGFLSGTAKFSDRTTVTFKSADPSKLLISTDSAPGAGSATFSSTGVFGCSLYALADSGSVDVVVSAPGFDPVTVAVPLVRSFVAFVNPGEREGVWKVPQSVAVRIVRASDNASSFGPSETPRPGLALPAFRIVNRNPEAGTLNLSVFPPTFEPSREGVAVIALESDTFPVLPAASTLTVRTRQPQIPIYNGYSAAILGKGLQFQLLANTRGVPIHAESSNPELVRVSASRDKIGSGEVDSMTETGVMVQAMADSGRATITVTAPGFDTFRTEVRLSPTAVRIDASTSQRDAFVPLGQNNIILMASLVPHVAGGTSGIVYGTFRLPGSEPLTIPIISSNPGLIEWSATEFRFDEESTRAITEVRGTVKNVGETTVEIQPPAALDSGLPSKNRLKFRVAPRTAAFTPLAISRNMQVLISLPEPSDGNATVTSPDPSRILVALPSQTNESIASGPGQSSITIPAGRNRFLVQALADNGQVQVEVRIPGYEASQLNVRLTPLRLTLGAPFNLPAALTPGQTLALPILPIGGQNHSYRTGAPSIELRLVSDNPGVAVPTETSFQYPEQASASLRAQGPGTATFTLTGPTDVDLSEAQYPVTVVLPAIKLRQDRVTLGKDLMTSVYMSTSDNSVPEITITSTDPSRLLLSSAPDLLGEASIRLRPGNQLMLQALANSGTVEVGFTAPGYTPAVLEVQLIPSAVVFTNGGDRVSVTRETSFYGGLAQVDPASGIPSGYDYYGLRPGAQLEVEVANSNESAGIVQGKLLINRSSSRPIQFIPKAGGVTTLTIIQPPGYVEPRSNNRITLDVAGPPKSFQWTPPASLPWATQYVSSLVFPAGSAPPAGAIARITASNTLVSVGGSTCVRPQNGPSTISIPATGSFCLVSGGNLGTTTIEIAIEGYQPLTATVRLSPTAIVFLPDTAEVAAGSSTRVKVQTVGLDASLRQIPGDLAISPVYGDLMVSVESSDEGVVRASPVSFPVGNGTNYVSIEGLKGGTATVRVTGPFNPVSVGSTLRVTVTAQSGKFNVSGNFVAPRTLGTQIAFTATPFPANNLNVTVALLDPAKGQLSKSSFWAPAPSLTFPASQSLSFYLNPIAAAGDTVQIRVSADGYETAILSVTVAQPAILFSVNSLTITVGSSQNVFLRYGYISGGLALPVPSSTIAPNAGAIRLFTESASIATPQFDSFAIATGDSSPVQIPIRGIARGTTLLRYTAPAGFATGVGRDFIPVTVQ